MFKKLIILATITTAISSTAFAQSNVLVNGDFESNPPQNTGNNVGHSIAPWVLGPGDDSNVVKVDGPGGYDYGSNGPESDASAPGPGIDQHYLDIAGGSNDFYQRFTPRCSGDVQFGGSFSTRGNSPGTGSVTIREGVGTSGAIVGSTNIVSLAGGTSRTDPWTVASFTAPILAGTTYSLIVAMDNNMNFDNGFVIYEVECDPEGCQDTCCLGPCCVDDICIETTAEYCAREDGIFQGEGQSCDLGRCVLGSLCFPTSQMLCEQRGGRWLGTEPCPIAVNP